MLIGSAPLTEDPNAFAMSVCAEDRCVFIGPKGTAMDSISDVFFSWQFLLVGLAVFLIFAFFNEVVGPRLWRVRWLRCVLKELEGIKVIWPPSSASPWDGYLRCPGRTSSITLPSSLWPYCTPWLDCAAYGL